MRHLLDEDGRRWEVVVGRESWGALLVLFIPAGEGEEVRQTLLEAASYAEATSYLNGLGEGELRRLFQRSEPKELGR